MNDVRCTFCDAMNPKLQRNCISCGAELPGAAEIALPDNVSLEAEILQLLRDQGKIAAVKRLREATGSGLAEAKQAVEMIEVGGTTSVPAPATGTEAAVLDIVRSQGKIAAIKRYRELTGCGLREAKSAVEGLMARTGIQAPAGAGCSTSAILTLCLLTGVLVWRLIV